MSASGGWVRFENTMPDNEKVIAVSDRAFRLWINASCYCSRALSDGRIPARLLLRLSISATKRAIQELLQAKLLEQTEAGDYVVHDYLKFNPSRERVDQMRESGRNRSAKWRADVDDVTDGVTPSPECHPRVRVRSEGVQQGNKQQQTDHARARSRRADQDVAPSSMPDSLVDTLEQALEILLAVQAERGGNVPTRRGVGLGLARFADRDHVAVARELEHWALAGNGQGRVVKDWARTFVTFLERTPAGATVRTRNEQPATGADVVSVLNARRSGE